MKTSVNQKQAGQMMMMMCDGMMCSMMMNTSCLHMCLDGI